MSYCNLAVMVGHRSSTTIVALRSDYEHQIIQIEEASFKTGYWSLFFPSSVCSSRIE